MWDCPGFAQKKGILLAGSSDAFKNHAGVLQATAHLYNAASAGCKVRRHVLLTDHPLGITAMDRPA